MKFLFAAFDTNGFTPHGMCLAWEPDLLVWTMASDALTALAYVWISVQLLVIVYGSTRGRRTVMTRDPWLIGLFGSFILLCGCTHVMHIITLFQPFYWVQMGLILVTGLVSIMTAGLMQWVFKSEDRDMNHDARNLAQQLITVQAQFVQLARGEMPSDRVAKIAERFEKRLFKDGSHAAE